MTAEAPINFPAFHDFKTGVMQAKQRLETVCTYQFYNSTTENRTKYGLT